MNLRKLAVENKRLAVWLAAIVVLGAVLMLMGRFMREPQHADNTAPDDGWFSSAYASPGGGETAMHTIAAFTYERALEERLEEFFALVEGAGRVRVMVSPLTAGETVFAVDVNASSTHTVEQDAEGGSREVRQQQSNTQTVMISDRQGSDRPLVLREDVPRVEGIVIIAEGGDCVFVRDALTRAARAVLGLDAHKIQVLTMRGE